MIENKFIKIFEKNFKIEKKLKVQLLKNKKNIIEINQNYLNL